MTKVNETPVETEYIEKMKKKLNEIPRSKRPNGLVQKATQPKR